MKIQHRSIRLPLILIGLAAVAALSAAKPGPQTPPNRGSANYRQYLAKEVRHQLVLLPYYSVFDNLQYQINGNDVTLSGQVRLPVLKSGAENAVKNIEGVGTVANNIEVLPLSPMDDQIRHAEFRAVYGAPEMEKYDWGAVPPIHIIVKGGHVTLEGVVDNETDKNVANIKANSVPNVFSVKNNLRVVPSK